MKKHNKLKNTGLLFEILCRKLTNESLNKTDLPSLKIIKQHFKAGSLLLQELRLYQNIISQPEPEVIDLAVKRYNTLNKKELSEAKYKLVKSIKSKYDLKEFMSSFVSDYKRHASIFNVLEETSEPVIVVESRRYLTEIKTEPEPLNEVVLDKQTSALTFKFIVNKFNEKYKTLSSKQQRLLSRYINEDHNSESFKNFIVTEAAWVSKKLTLAANKTTNEVLRIKLNEVVNLTHNIVTAKVIKDDQLSSLLKYYELIDELK